MQVEVDVQNGETLRTGVRTSNQYKDGSRETSTQAGLFKVDHFRMELKELFTGSGATAKSDFPLSITGSKGGISIRYTGEIQKGSLSVYSVLGTQLYSRTLSGTPDFISLAPGIYIVKTAGNGKECVTKVVVS
jgi:hypothetical protein